MNESLVDKICQEFKSDMNKKVKDIDLFTLETELLKYIMNLGSDMSSQLFKEYGTGYKGNIIKKKQ